MSKNQQDIQAAFFQALATKLDDTETVDFTITCSGQEFKVHKVIVSLHSKYFDRVFKSGYKENREGRIDLVDDPKAAVKCMIDYFYKFDYDFEMNDTGHDLDFIPEKYTGEGEDKKILPPEKFTFSPPNPTPLHLPPSALHGHAYMYTLGDKYEILSLKKLAKQKFEAEAETNISWTMKRSRAAGEWCKCNRMRPFYNTIPYIYTHTAPNEMGLRASVTKVWRSSNGVCSRNIHKDNLMELIKDHPDFALDLITGTRSSCATEDDCYSEADSNDDSEDEVDEYEDEGFDDELYYIGMWD